VAPSADVDEGAVGHAVGCDVHGVDHVVEEGEGEVGVAGSAGACGAAGYGGY